MTVHCGLPLRLDRRLIILTELRGDYVDNIIARCRQLDLGKIMDEVVVATVRVDKHNLLKSIAGDLAARTFEESNCKLRLDADTTRGMPRFQNLGEDVIGEYDRRFQRGDPITQLTPDEHVRRQRQMMSVPLDAR